jgi:hypothetical protein
MIEDECSRDLVVSKDLSLDQAPPLTYDEKKAAEAAFRGQPFNPAWSVAAAKVYGGIIAAMSHMQTPALDDSEVDAECMAGR